MILNRNTSARKPPETMTPANITNPKTRFCAWFCTWCMCPPIALLFWPSVLILECQDSCRQVGYLLLKRFCDHDQRNTAKNRARANTKHPARSHSGIERLADFSQAARPSPTITTRARPEIRAWE